MISREVAQLTGKNHQHVLRDCDALNAEYEKLGLSKIGQGYYTHPNTGDQQHREYILTKMQCFDLLTGYSAENGHPQNKHLVTTILVMRCVC